MTFIYVKQLHKLSDDEHILFISTFNSQCVNRFTVTSHLPMLRVTVIMFSDMVESVMLLNDDDWRE